jgi:hypothetical protein
LKQRKTQQRNAERRLRKHCFCFTTNYERLFPTTQGKSESGSEGDFGIRWE